MITSKAPPQYDQTLEQEFRQTVSRSDDQNVKKGTDIIMRGGRTGSRNPQIVLYSPNGSGFSLSVADDGTLTAVAL